MCQRPVHCDQFGSWHYGATKCTQTLSFDVASKGSIADHGREIREFFLNIIMDRDAVKSLVLRNAGFAGSLFGILAESLGVKHIVSDEQLAAEVAPMIIDSIRHGLQRSGVNGTVALVLLPPMPGRGKWSELVHLGDDKMNMVFNVQVVETYRPHHGDTSDPCCGLFDFILSADVMIEKRPPPLTQADVRSLASIVQEDVRRRTKQITAIVHAADRQEEFEVLQSYGWCPRLINRALATTRWIGAPTSRIGSHRSFP